MVPTDWASLPLPLENAVGCRVASEFCIVCDEDPEALVGGPGGLIEENVAVATQQYPVADSCGASGLDSQDQNRHEQGARNCLDLALGVFSGIMPGVSEVPRVLSHNHDSSWDLPSRVVREELEEDRVHKAFMADLNLDGHIAFQHVISQIGEGKERFLQPPTMSLEVALNLPRKILELPARDPKS